MIRGGYVGKYLDVDLETGRIDKFNLPEEVLRTWVGCSGLGLHLLAQEITPDLESTDPRTPMFIMTGPLTGTAVPSSSNWTIVTLHSNPALHSAPCIAHGHGWWAARLKQARWDGIAIRGASPTPVYLFIDDDKVELRDARHLWGVDTNETVRQILNEAADPENTSVACIGPAGETQVVGAAVRADHAYGATSGSPGVVWGAKKLKAIAVRGTRPVSVANPEAFLDQCQQWTDIVKEWKYEQWMGFTGGPGKDALDARAKEAMDAGAHCFQPAEVNEEAREIVVGMSPGKNWTDPEFATSGGAGMFLRAPEQCPWKVTGVGSWNCDINCHADVTVTSGPYVGLEWLTYGGAMEVATTLGIQDPYQTVALGQHLDAVGICCSEFGAVVGMALEMYNEGLLTKEDTDGLDLTWGNFEPILELLEQMMRKEGLGAVLAKGPKEAARELDAPSEMVVHIRGSGQRHDTKYMGLGWQFGLIMAGAGPVWQSWPENFKEPDWDHPERPPRYTAEGKGTTTAVLQIKKQWIDCPGICLFVSLAMPEVDKTHLPRAMEYAVGWEGFSFEEGALVGERVIALQRLINLYRGYRPGNDYDVGERVMAPMTVGHGKGVALGDHFDKMRQDYYDALNWDPVTGWPRLEALRKLGLEGYKVGLT
jgi:aldehyde:ferredoxin oxidoreductase